MEYIRVEVEIEDRGETEFIEVEGGDLDAVLKGVRALAALDDIHVFERDADEPIGGDIKHKKALSVVAHRCKRVDVEVRYEHLTKAHEFAPSATVFRVLQWAIGKHGYNLDDTARAKANLILPDAEQPLPPGDVIGRLVKHDDHDQHHDHRHECKLIVDLTLRDFTNG
jgi:hypothetical protein